MPLGKLWLCAAVFFFFLFLLRHFDSVFRACRDKPRTAHAAALGSHCCVSRNQHACDCGDTGGGWPSRLRHCKLLSLDGRVADKTAWGQQEKPIGPASRAHCLHRQSSACARAEHMQMQAAVQGRGWKREQASKQATLFLSFFLFTLFNCCQAEQTSLSALTDLDPPRALVWPPWSKVLDCPTVDGCLCGGGCRQCSTSSEVSFFISLLPTSFRRLPTFTLQQYLDRCFLFFNLLNGVFALFLFFFFFPKASADLSCVPSGQAAACGDMPGWMPTAVCAKQVNVLGQPWNSVCLTLPFPQTDCAPLFFLLFLDSGSHQGSWCRVSIATRRYRQFLYWLDSLPLCALCGNRVFLQPRSAQ